MLKSQMPQHAINLGNYRRTDGEAFDIAGVLYESPATFDFWSITFDAKHSVWGHLPFSLSIPKRIAIDVPTAILIAKGSAADQVRVYLDTASKQGRGLFPYFSPDGWVLC